MFFYETKAVKNKPLGIKRRKCKNAISLTFKRLQLKWKEIKKLFLFYFFILADGFPIALKKKKKKEFTVRGKLSLIGYYCIYYIIKKRRAIIFFLPASCIYWKRPVLRSSEECSVFEA